MRKYFEEIENSPDILISETVSKHWNSITNQTTGRIINQDTVIQNKILHNKLDHYEKLYRCFIESRRVGREKLTVVAVTIAVSVVLLATIFCCAFGPNFKSQKSVDTSSSTETLMINGYGGHGSYGYTYFQESENGRR